MTAHHCRQAIYYIVYHSERFTISRGIIFYINPKVKHIEYTGLTGPQEYMGEIFESAYCA